jgi:hypothetical protein
MKVKIINNKIVEVNTVQSDIDLPDNLVGTSLSKWLYIDNQFVENPDWADLTVNPTEEDSIEYIKKWMDWAGIAYDLNDTKSDLLQKIDIIQND